MAKLEVEGVTLDGGESLSTAIDLRTRILRAVIVPTPWTTADIAFQSATAEDGTFADVMDWDGNRWVTGGDDGQHVIVRPELGQALQWAKAESVDTATPATPIPQGNADLPAVITFDVSDFDFSGGSADLTFNLTVDGGTPQAVSITAATTDAAGFVAALEADLDDSVVVAAVDTDTFTITTVSVGADASLVIDSLVDEGTNTTLTGSEDESGTDQSETLTIYLLTELRPT